jgi:hypothetical protein
VPPVDRKAVLADTTIDWVWLPTRLPEFVATAWRWIGHRREPPVERKIMATIHFHQTTTATPEQFIAGLTDFGPGRSELFKNSADSYLRVHGRGPQWADVTEGSGGVWERINYDWSNPHHVVVTTTDSNLFGGASGHTYTLTPRPDGTTDIDVVLVREGKNLKGRIVAGVLATIGKRSLVMAFANSVKAIEVRVHHA